MTRSNLPFPPFLFHGWIFALLLVSDFDLHPRMRFDDLLQIGWICLGFFGRLKVQITIGWRFSDPNRKCTLLLLIFCWSSSDRKPNSAIVNICLLLSNCNCFHLWIREIPALLLQPLVSQTCWATLVNFQPSGFGAQKQRKIPKLSRYHECPCSLISMSIVIKENIYKQNFLHNRKIFEILDKMRHHAARTNILNHNFFF